MCLIALKLKRGLSVLMIIGHIVLSNTSYGRKILAAGGNSTAAGYAGVNVRRDPLPRWFGFHEVFHVCTVVAWACQCVACYLAVL